MDDIQFKELVKICVDKLKDETIFELIKNDTEYQKTAEKEGIAEKAFLELELTAEQRNVCNHLLECRGQQECEYATFAYIAGINDAFRILNLFFPR